MFVPLIIPSVPHTSVVNKTVVYSDVVLPLNQIGKKLKVTSISDIEEHTLEKCLKTVLEANPFVTFHTIQYSKGDRKLYFYTDAEITTKSWENSKVSVYAHLKAKTQILEEVKRILTSEKSKEEDVISLYDVVCVLREMENNLERIKKNYAMRCQQLVKMRFGSSASIVIHNFDYDKSTLNVEFDYVGNEYQKITFSKREGDLYIFSSESCWSKEVFATLHGELSRLYDELMAFKDFKKEVSYNIKAFNASFIITIDSYGVDVFTKSSLNPYSRDFELSTKSYKCGYEYDCNSSEVLDALQGNEDELFKRIFVKIADCPAWSRVTLSETRKRELEIERAIEENQKYREMKRQKRFALAKKIFPFLKEK